MAYNPDLNCMGILSETEGVNLNASAPSDIAELKIAASEYLPTRLVIHDVSAAAAASTVGLYTSPGGGGTEIMAPIALAGLTAANKCAVIDLSSFADQITSATLYLRLTVAAGSAATCHVALYGYNFTH